MLLSFPADHARVDESFSWNLPDRYNIGVDVADRWARLTPGRPAIIDAFDDGLRTTTFADLRRRSSRLAGVLRRLGVERGDRIAVFLPQTAEVIVAHVAIYKLGAIVLPLAAVFGADALAHRVSDSGAILAITDAAGVARLKSLEPTPPTLGTIISIDGPDGSIMGFTELLEAESSEFEPVATRPDDPALMIYTSGTTGLPRACCTDIACFSDICRGCASAMTACPLAPT